MGIEYDLCLDTNLAPADVIRRLSQYPGLTRTNDSKDLYGFGLYISCIKGSEPGQSIAQEAWGICPTVLIDFRCISLYDASDRSDEYLVKISIDLLTDLPGDAVLLFNYEKPLLLRRSGELILNRDYDEFWTMPEQLACVTLPYTMGSVPSD